MDEQVSDERRRTTLDRYTAGFVRSRMETCSLDMPKRLKHEVATRLSIYDDVVNKREGAHYGKAPFVREKPHTQALVVGKPLVLTCIFTGDPEPTVLWFKNDNVLKETDRMSFKTEDGKSTLTIKEVQDYDAGLYKVAARNTLGQVAHRFRLLLAHAPGIPDVPEVPDASDTEMLVRWSPPFDDGGSQILCYELQMRMKGEEDEDYRTVANNIDHEFYLVRGLAPNTRYQFRLAANNRFGWSDFSVGCMPTSTGESGAPKVRTTHTMQMLQEETDSGKAVVPFVDKTTVDYRRETDHLKPKTGENAELQIRKYQMVGQVARGRFSMVARCVRTDDRRTFCAKLLAQDGRVNETREEMEVFRSMRHEKVAQMYEAYSVRNVTVLIMEALSGVDVLTHLASRHTYTEQNIASITNQVCDALSYLNWRGYCHLDLQPDNIVLTSPRHCEVKLVDFGSTQHVSKQGQPVTSKTLLDFTAPEVLADQLGHPTSDVWSLGVLVYLFLAGRPAFQGPDEDETRENILNVRFKYDLLGSNTTQEATRFLMLIFKRDPNKRPTVDDCREHKWLVDNDHITKKRERAFFPGAQLMDYDQSYHRRRAAQATTNPDLTCFGGDLIPPAIAFDTESQL